ncbi:putative lipase/esterase [Capsulimonas corticalis]|uniref:Lipase/esterase n=1 Tax=Capsulimonas corticalis TaxID=2219043 RepID=A0A402D1S2_9BACT|nr:alpha/beta hydrolase [Capsulimonas corticalis]BDI28673.1 putative lipase/esterase [Capsulimonas corticalis]
MPLDPQVAALLEKMRAAGAAPIGALPMEETRAAARGLIAWQAAPPAVDRVQDLRIPASDADIPVRAYTPLGAAAAPPILVFSHGGGWFRGTLDIFDTPCRQLANATGCLVVSVDYRLAPEHKFPLPLNDCWEVTQWIAAHGADLGGDPSRLIVAGDSSGGNLAAAVARRTRDAGGPPIAAQLLIYPVTNCAFDTPSYTEFAQGYSLTRASMETCWDYYLSDPADAASPDASPLRAPDFTSLPPAVILTAEYDPLRDDGEQYADKLQSAGVPVHRKRLPGLIHGALHMTGIVDASKQIYEEAGEGLRVLLGGK